MARIGFHPSSDSGRQRWVAAGPSVIVQGAPDHHHFIYHPPAPISKFVAQNSQAFHRSQRVLHGDSMPRQQPVKAAPLPMEFSTSAPLPRGHQLRPTHPQALKPAVPQDRDSCRQSQARVFGHRFVMPARRDSGRAPQDFAFPNHNHVLDRVAFLAPAVIPALLRRSLRPGQTPLGAVDNYFLQFGLLGQQLGQLAGLARGPVQRDQLAHRGRQALDPFADLALGDTEKQTHHVLRRIGLVIEQNKKELLLGGHQTALASAPPVAAAEASLWRSVGSEDLSTGFQIAAPSF